MLDFKFVVLEAFTFREEIILARLWIVSFIKDRLIVNLVFFLFGNVGFLLTKVRTVSSLIFSRGFCLCLLFRPILLLSVFKIVNEFIAFIAQAVDEFIVFISHVGDEFIVFIPRVVREFIAFTVDAGLEYFSKI